ncbi:hypothetical protein [Neptuniibacter halophilus]|uniref:hypothetical protein n=1 Tax=Neptuniibacter halophilus TaxID=651666 RepID=UPI002573732D|nr:hypothetical protein [Neptuniibacter halophilus]
MKKTALVIAIGGLSLLPVDTANACGTCRQANSYGNYVVGETNTATGEVRSATEAIRIGFDMMITAIKAMSDNVTSELHKGQVVQKTMLDELNRQMEQREKAEYIVESNQFYEERYGENNIPLSACEDWSDALAMAVAKDQTEEELRGAIDTFFTEYRLASPVDDWRYHNRTLEFASAGDVDLNQAVLSNDEVQQAVEMINQTIEPVPVTPLHPDAVVAELSADDRALRSQIQSLNLRLDAPKQALKEQVMLKAPIVDEETSVQSILEERAYDGIDPETLADISSGSEMRTLRTLLRDQQYGNVMVYEHLKASLRTTRIMSMELAARSDMTRKGYRYLQNQLDAKNAVR